MHIIALPFFCCRISLTEGGASKPGDECQRKKEKRAKLVFPYSDLFVQILHVLITETCVRQLTSFVQSLPSGGTVDTALSEHRKCCLATPSSFIIDFLVLVSSANIRKPCPQPQNRLAICQAICQHHLSMRACPIAGKPMSCSNPQPMRRSLSTMPKAS